MRARHSCTLNSRHTDLHCWSVSWWLRMVCCVWKLPIIVHPDTEGCKRNKSRWNQACFNTAMCERHLPQTPTHSDLTRTNAKHGGKKKDRRDEKLEDIKNSLLSLQSWQYKVKWLFNIPCQPPKWWVGVVVVEVVVVTVVVEADVQLLQCIGERWRREEGEIQAQRAQNLFRRKLREECLQACYTSICFQFSPIYSLINYLRKKFLSRFSNGPQWCDKILNVRCLCNNSNTWNGFMMNSCSSDMLGSHWMYCNIRSQATVIDCTALL